jgi:Ca-activated chloride channel family protein
VPVLFDPATLRFGEPAALWLLIVPAVLLPLWAWQAARRIGDRRRLLRHRQVPVRERYARVGGLLFWLCLIIATASAIVALAEPRARVSLVRRTGIDLVVLQDGSASMRVADVAGDRWQRSIRFLWTLAEALRWKEDRIAMALFAHIATPQVRLTRDPNTFFFFLDHLRPGSPFRLEDDSTWDTNIELGIHWGLRLIEKDAQLHGESANTKAFVLVSDGQAWSGTVRTSLSVAQQRGMPVHVVGVGTTAGGEIPEPPRPIHLQAAAPAPLRSSLDRASLRAIAAAGGGEYFEMDRDSDRQIANAIIAATRRRTGPRGLEETTEDLYWRCLVAAAGFVLLGTLFLRDRLDLWTHLIGASTALGALAAWAAG